MNALEVMPWETQKRIAQVSFRMLTAPVMGDDSLHDAIVAGLRAVTESIAAARDPDEGSFTHVTLKAKPPASRWKLVARDAVGNEVDVLVDIIGQQVPVGEGARANRLIERGE